MIPRYLVQRAAERWMRDNGNARGWAIRQASKLGTRDLYQMLPLGQRLGLRFRHAKSLPRALVGRMLAMRSGGRCEMQRSHNRNSGSDPARGRNE